VEAASDRVSDDVSVPERGGEEDRS